VGHISRPTHAHDRGLYRLWVGKRCQENADRREEMALEDEIGHETKEAEPIGPLANGGARIAAVVLALVALAGISAGAWLRLRRA
jgi:hypothetical protein